MPNKSYTYLLNVKQFSVFKSYNAEFDDIVITFTNQNKKDMLFYRTKNKKICQRIRISVIRKKSIQQMWRKLLDTATKARLDATKAASRKVVQKTTEATRELI